MSILHRAIEELNAEYITTTTAARVKALLREALEQIEGFREDCHRMKCTISDAECFDASELLDILAGEEEAPIPAAPEMIKPTPEMRVAVLASALAARQATAAAAKATAAEAAKARRNAEDALEEARQEEEAAADDLDVLDREVEELENALSTAKAMMTH